MTASIMRPSQNFLACHIFSRFLELSFQSCGVTTSFGVVRKASGIAKRSFRVREVAMRLELAIIFGRKREEIL